MLKDNLRGNAKKLRDKIANPNKATELRDYFIKHVDLPPHSIVAAYWPIGSEIDVKPLIKELYEQGHDICLPCMVAPNRPLIFRSWEPDIVMKKGQHRIYEPCQTREEMTPTVILVPLVAFDKTRHRLGYGGGYYDRTIKTFYDQNIPVQTIGIAYSEQEIEEIPAEEFDVQLDKIVTCRKVFE